MLEYWIWLAERKGLSCRQKIALLQHFPTVEALWQAEHYGGVPAALLGNSLLDKRLEEAFRILRQCREQNIRILTIGDSAYPRRLRAIADPPLVLYYKGVLPDFDREAVIGVVGTRRASAYGLMAAERLSKQIAQAGGLVVSGMAAGVDAQAGWGALHGGAPTVCVLGGGVDIVYPATNRDLYTAVEQQGCLISEYPPGTRPATWTFPQRNRIVSGLSCGVLVVEAPEKSGTMITARLALQQGRDLFVVPGHIDSDFCAGSNALLRDGAKVATSGWDVMSEYEGLFPDKISKRGRSASQPQAAAAASTPQRKTVDITGATPEEQRLMEPLLQGERTVDDLIAASGLEPQTALAMLTMLEIKGMVTTLPGRRVTLS